MSYGYTHMLYTYECPECHSRYESYVHLQLPVYLPSRIRYQEDVVKPDDLNESIFNTVGTEKSSGFDCLCQYMSTHAAVECELVDQYPVTHHTSNTRA